MLHGKMLIWKSWVLPDWSKNQKFARLDKIPDWTREIGLARVMPDCFGSASLRLWARSSSMAVVAIICTPFALRNLDDNVDQSSKSMQHCKA